MNIFFSTEDKVVHSPRIGVKLIVVISIFVGLLLAMVLVFGSVSDFVFPGSVPVLEVRDVVVVPVPTFSIVAEIAASFGVPVRPMERLARFLKENDFNSKYGGVGLFCVKPSHLGWLEGSVLANTKINLEDELQNTQVAAFLLKRYHDSGYSWENCFVAYVFGVAAINSGKYSDFILYLFE